MPKILLDQFAPSQGLSGMITKELDVADARSMKRRTVGFSVLFFVCLVLLVPAFIYLNRDLHTSGFTSFFSLIFSDTSLLVAHLKEFSLSLLEALPVVSLVAFLIVFAGLGWALAALLFLVHRARGRRGALGDSRTN
jgi:hypothetical protein